MSTYVDLLWRAARLRRDPYLRMTLAPDGVADGALIVAAIHGVLVVPALIRGADLVVLVRFVLSGMFGWLILSGLVYLIGRHLLEGYGSYQGMMAASSLAYGPLLLAIPIALFIDVGFASLIPSIWLLACVWMAAQQALELSKEHAALAAIGGYAAWVIIQTILSF
ncbi:MAG: YIP1 family protein [Acidimicrobiia bacterium]|nr:YIP1 family protein [Acidimicrobiia bacterium]